MVAFPLPQTLLINSNPITHLNSTPVKQGKKPFFLILLVFLRWRKLPNVLF